METHIAFLDANNCVSFAVALVAILECSGARNPKCSTPEAPFPRLEARCAFCDKRMLKNLRPIGLRVRNRSVCGRSVKVLTSPRAIQQQRDIVEPDAQWLPLLVLPFLVAAMASAMAYFMAWFGKKQTKKSDKNQWMKGFCS